MKSSFARRKPCLITDLFMVPIGEQMITRKVIGPVWGFMVEGRQGTENGIPSTNLKLSNQLELKGEG